MKLSTDDKWLLACVGVFISFLGYISGQIYLCYLINFHEGMLK